MGVKDIRMVSTLCRLVAWALDRIHLVRQREEWLADQMYEYRLERYGEDEDHSD